MTRQKYIPQDNQWILYAEFSREEFVEAVYTQVGQRFEIDVNGDGTVMFDPATLPDGITENDVKQAVKDNHPHR